MKLFLRLNLLVTFILLSTLSSLGQNNPSAELNDAEDEIVFHTGFDYSWRVSITDLVTNKRVYRTAKTISIIDPSNEQIVVSDQFVNGRTYRIDAVKRELNTALLDMNCKFKIDITKDFKVTQKILNSTLHATASNNKSIYTVWKLYKSNSNGDILGSSINNAIGTSYSFPIEAGKYYVIANSLGFHAYSSTKHFKAGLNFTTNDYKLEVTDRQSHAGNYDVDVKIIKKTSAVKSCKITITYRDRFNIERTHTTTDFTATIRNIKAQAIKITYTLSAPNYNDYNSDSKVRYIIGNVIDVIDSKSASANNNNSEIKVYPNPTSENITINSKLDGTKDVIVTDINGKQLKQASFSSDKGDVSLEGLNAGIYYVHILQDDIIVGQKKIVKQ